MPFMHFAYSNIQPYALYSKIFISVDLKHNDLMLYFEHKTINSTILKPNIL